jgi:MerR HTH family regulatory protein
MSTTVRNRSRTGTSLATRGSGLIGIDALARAAGIHPDLARRLVALGLIEQRGGTNAAPLFRPQDAPALARAIRLRRDLGLNYAGAVLACELLARTDELEERLRGRARPTHSKR